MVFRRRVSRQMVALLAAAGFAGAGVVLAGAPVGAATATGAREALITKADQICAESQVRLVKAAKPFEKHKLAKASGSSTSNRYVAKPSEVREFVTTAALTEVAATISQLRLLQAPPADRAEFASIMKGLDAALAATKKNPVEAAYTDPFEKVSTQMRAFGFQVCGERPRSTK